jgi:glyoxylase-like metal-dependent hydrolase (beta-lactamase superfamily II)
MNDKGRLRAAIVPVTPFEQNCTLIWDESSRKGVVIDPGGDVQAILDAIAQTGMTVETIFLTHGHIDHVGGAEELKARLGVQIQGPNIADKPLCDGIERQAEMFGVPGQFHNAHPDRWLSEGDTVMIGGHAFEVFHCPGHSPGHVVFFNRDARFAHVGDVLFSGSVGRTDLPGGDHAALISAIKEKLLPLGDDVSFICGHGPGSTFGRERLSNPFLT